MRKIFIIALVVSLLVLTIISGCTPPAPPTPPAAKTTPTPPPAATKVTELKWAMQQVPMATQIKDFAIPIAEEIGKRSNGRLKVTVYPAEALGKGAEQWTMLANRVCDITELHPAAYSKYSPLAAFVSVPFGLALGMKNKNGEYIVDVIGQKYVAPKAPFKIMSFAQYGMNQFLLGKKQVKTLEDCKGLILGYTGGKPYQLQMQAMGIAPEQIGLPDTYIAIDKGTIDGYYAGASIIESFALAPVIKNITTDIDINTSLVFDGINNDTYKSLSPEDQKVIDGIGPFISEKWYGIQRLQNDKGMGMAKEKGAQIYNLPAAERARWLDACKGVGDQWGKDMDAQGLPGTQLVNDLRQMIAEAK